MEVAFAAGIRHFDTLYGLGAAEAMVGKFAANKRATSRSPPSSVFGLPPVPLDGHCKSGGTAGGAGGTRFAR